MKPRTSQTHPLQIGTVETLEGGRIGLTFCPGKHDPHAVTGPWARDLAADLAAISDWGALTLVTLLEDHELELLNVPGLGEAAKAAGLSWLHLPIRDVSIPGPIFERLWQQVYGARLRTSLMRGEEYRRALPGRSRPHGPGGRPASHRNGRVSGAGPGQGPHGTARSGGDIGAGAIRIGTETNLSLPGSSLDASRIRLPARKRPLTFVGAPGLRNSGSRPASNTGRFRGR